ncbi:MAG: class I mannose-6-phosphate isomerase, partial [Verrucomicrobiota bacterium]
GEPKTEMWFIAAATDEADLYAGLKRDVSRADFEGKLKRGNVTECFHRIPVKAGDALFLPSGRVHAIGAGNVIFEIQQNSDTTYRVFDWNRVEANGQPRELHVEKSLASIDFNDFEPSLISRETKIVGDRRIRTLVRDSLFTVKHCAVEAPSKIKVEAGMKILGVIEGKLNVKLNVNSSEKVSLSAGQFCLIPASQQNVVLIPETHTAFLEISLG